MQPRFGRSWREIEGYRWGKALNFFRAIEGKIKWDGIINVNIR